MNYSVNRHRLLKTLFVLFIQPRSKNSESQRREYALNILLIALFLLASTALLITLISSHTGRSAHATVSLVTSLGFEIFICGLWWAARRRWYLTVAYVLVLLIATLGMQLILEVGFMVTSGELTLVLAVVIAGLVLPPRAALAVTSLIVISLMAIGYLESYQVLHASTEWLNQPQAFGDALVYGIILSVIGLVSWLASREIDRLLRVAARSEADLEAIVFERTKRIEELQLKRTQQSQRFVEFGQRSAGIVHDLSNALNTLAINLEELEAKNNRQILNRVRKNARYLEQYFEAARQQIVGESARTNFDVKEEVNHVRMLLESYARSKNVRVRIRVEKAMKVYGDPAKFSQIISNVIINAIDSYQFSVTENTQSLVNLLARQTTDQITITVTDNGIGIPLKDLNKVFEPFYSTKPLAERGMGIGLTTVKQLVEGEFKGTVRIFNVQNGGTRVQIDIKKMALPTQLKNKA